MKGKGILLGFLIIVLGAAVSTHAALVDMGDGTIYDTDAQLSWLKDANYAMTSAYDADGHMTWSEALTWASTLNAGGGFAGLTSWRLPATTQPDATCQFQQNPVGFPSQGFGENCTGSEMGHLYYVSLGNAAGGPLTNTGPFTNLQADYYWSGTEYAPNTSSGAWYFNFSYGTQSSHDKSNTNCVWAVCSGERAVCGDGIVESGEQCDDNNTAAGDGCSATCTIESGYSCSGSPSVCTPSATSVGYDLEWLIITFASLMLAGGYLLRRRMSGTGRDR